MPSKPGQTDPKGVASIIYEDYAILAIRVRRLLEARALVLTPMPRTTHLISNIEVTADGCTTNSPPRRLSCASNTKATSSGSIPAATPISWFGSNGSFRIALKRVELIDCDGKHSPMTIPI